MSKNSLIYVIYILLLIGCITSKAGTFAAGVYFVAFATLSIKVYFIMLNDEKEHMYDKDPESEAEVREWIRQRGLDNGSKRKNKRCISR